MADNTSVSYHHFHITQDGIWICLEMINEARAARGEEPLQIKDIADRVPARSNMSIRHLKD